MACSRCCRWPDGSNGGATSRPCLTVADQRAVIAIVGAESTGKTTLAAGLTQALQAEGVSAVMVPEFLREFCDEHGRTPFPHEQLAIAREQTRRIVQSAQQHAVVVADTTALMTAVYSD